MRNAEGTAQRLNAIKQLGVQIAIDDFGTGYSSLAHLQRFPVDALKIDQSFISGLRRNEEGKTLIRTLVQLGKALSIETFAEGIEEQHELSLLQEEDCDSGQGFLFAHPLDVPTAEAFLRSFANGEALREGALRARSTPPEPRWSWPSLVGRKSERGDRRRRRQKSAPSPRRARRRAGREAPEGPQRDRPESHVAAA